MTEPISMEEDDDKQAPENQRPVSAAEAAAMISKNRKEKRKLTKKEKRKQKRKEFAEKARQEEEAKLNDPEELRRIQLEEEREKDRLERERREFEEREWLFLEALARKKAEEEQEEERRRAEEEEEKARQSQVALENEPDGDDEWEYVEDGPPEIIWQGNEIIVKRNKVKLKKKDAVPIMKEDPNRPTSNPLPPQSEVFAEYKNASSLSAQQLLENVAQQTPNFGTEQDKAHCPFHLKTGACRFGSCCSRVHFYPDKSCTLLMKNMYAGPGLAWEQDEGLECTDEEIECSYEEFYEDVHTEFLKSGEIVNFKVCRNTSSHLRGNVYVHYKDMDSALLAYHSMNGRYYAGKQITCEFVSVTKWKVAICGEFMKSKLKGVESLRNLCCFPNSVLKMNFTSYFFQYELLKFVLQSCSRGTTCNFIHCFRNPGGDYEWADLDKPPPRYWLKKMASLFGYTDDSIYDREHERNYSERMLYSYERPAADSDRHRSVMSDSRERRPCSREIRSSRFHYEDRDIHKAHEERHDHTDRKHRKILDKKLPEEETDEHDVMSYSRERRSRSRESRSSRFHYEDRDIRKAHQERHDRTDRKHRKILDKKLPEEETGEHGINRYNSSDSDLDLSDTAQERVRHRHSSRKRSRNHHNEKRDRRHCNGDGKRGTCGYASGDDLLEKSGYRDARSGNIERTGSRRRKEDHSTDSSGEWEVRERDLHHKKRRGRSGHHNSVPSSPDRRDKKSGSHDNNITGDWTGNVKDRRKASSDKSVDSDTDYQYHNNEVIEERGRWEPDEGAVATHSKSSTKSGIDVSEDDNVESKLNSGGEYSGSTTRGSSRSSDQKKSGSWDERETTKKNKRKRSKENDRRHKEKDRSYDGHKHLKLSS